MKRVLLFILLGLATQLSVFAQFGGKPVYDILAVQGSDTLGTIRVEMYPEIAPLHVANFDSIVKAPISFDNRAFHRIIPDFMIQGGDPNSISGPESTWGQGDPSQANVDAEFSPLSHNRGILSAARRGDDINSASSQFFICVANSPHLDNQYTIYGNAISGMAVADTIVYKPVVNTDNNRPVDKIEMFIDYIHTDSTIPANAPESLTPADGTVDLATSTSFSWNAPATNDFLLYTIHFSQTSDFSDMEKIIHVNSNSTSWYVGDLEQGFKQYYWRVCANNGGNLNCSETRTLTTYLPKPNLIFPYDSLDPTSTLPNLTWESTEQAEEYHVQVSRNSNFNITLQIALDTVVSDTSFLITDTLLTNSKYYWHVAPVKDGKEGSFSDIWTFTTTQFVGIADATSSSKLKYYPNPTSSLVNISLDQNLSDVEIKIINQWGQEIFSDYYQNNGTIRLDLTNQPAGMYFIQVFNSNKNELLGIGKVALQPLR